MGEVAWSKWRMDPIRHSVTVAASPEVAFEVFSLGMGSWWDPTYTPDADSLPAHPSTIEADFTTEETGARVDFEHGGWTDDNAAARAKYGDWSHLLRRYADAAAGIGEPPG